MESIRQVAQQVASIAHQGQYRRSGEPYVTHPNRVTEILLDYYPDAQYQPSLIAASLLHDTLEDTDLPEEDIQDLFGNRTLTLVQQLTNADLDKEAWGKDAYLKDKLLRLDGEALLIKMADRMANVEDLHTAPEKWATKYATQTLSLLLYVVENRHSIDPHTLTLIEDILEVVADYLDLDSDEYEI